MRILNIGVSDTAGDGIRTKRAFDRHASDWTYNAAYVRRKLFEYPVDRQWQAAPKLARQADVLHLRNRFDLQDHLGLKGRPAVIHHHGTIFRNNRDLLLTEQRRRKAIGLAATLDLWLDAPDVLEWLPAPYDLDWLASLAQPNTGRALRIAHAPTDRRIKSTDAFLAAVDKLSGEIPVELILIEGQTWAKCLNLKATADVYFDQTILGYGNNAIEAWGMGIPVIAGADEATLTEMERRFGSLPFLHADEGSIYDALVVMADPDERAWWSRRGLEHVKQWHDEKHVVEQLKKVYQRAAR